MTTTAPTDQTVESFHDHGFTSITGLLSADEVARFRVSALEVAGRDGKKDEMGGTGIIATTDAWEKNDTLRGLALHPRIGAMAERLAGMPLRVWGGEVLAKPPHESSRTGLHDDLTFQLLDSRITFNVWIALGDVPVERGCLTFLAGSHLRAAPERIDLSQIEDFPGSYMIEHWPELQWSRRVTVPLRAGDATFHHSRTAHQAGGNATEDVRLAFLVTFTDAEATYRPLPGHDPLPLKASQSLPDERYPRVSR